jgi:hypothetical protein
MNLGFHEGRGRIHDAERCPSRDRCRARCMRGKLAAPEVTEFAERAAAPEI